MATPRQGLSPDFIERLNTDLDIFGILQDPSQPPMTETFLHVRRKQDGSAGGAVLGLPAFVGPEGPAGPALVHQGDRSSADLAALREALGPAQKNYAYRNIDNNDMYVWNGQAFIVYADAFGAEGDDGPPPVMQGGSVTVGGELLDAPAQVRVTGADGLYSVGLDLPPLPQGEQGIQGPAGSVFNSVDIAGAPSADGQILVFDDDADKMVWRDGYLGPKLWSVPSSAFGDWSSGINATRHNITTVTIPAQPYRYRLEFGGGVEVSSILGQTVDVQVLADDPDNGTMVGCAFGDMETTGWAHQRFGAFSADPLTPDSTGIRAGIVEAGVAQTLHVVAVKSAGLGVAWRVAGNGRSSLRVYVERLP